MIFIHFPFSGTLLNDPRGMEDWMLWSNQKILRSRGWFAGGRRVLQVKKTALEKDFQMQISLYSETVKFLIISFDFFLNFLNLFAFLNFGFKSISWAIYTLWYVHQPAQVILWESQQMITCEKTGVCFWRVVHNQIFTFRHLYKSLYIYIGSPQSQGFCIVDYFYKVNTNLLNWYF